METRNSSSKSLRNRRVNTIGNSPPSNSRKQPTTGIKRKPTYGQSTRTSTNQKQRTTTTSRKRVTKSDKPPKLQRSKSFERYGVVLPKYEDILDDCKKTEEYEKKVKRLEKLKNLDVKLPYDFDNNKKTKKESLSQQNYLDCQHLSMQQIEESFEKYKTTLDNILNGRQSCQRHEQYHKFNRKALIHNTHSIIVFNQDQRLHMLDLMHKTFDTSDRLINYFFQVLLPELCLFIFMDTHCMTREQAEKYLKDRPVDCSL